MSNTYTQLLTQLVIAVKCRQSLILEPVRCKSFVELPIAQLLRRRNRIVG